MHIFEKIKLNLPLLLSLFFIFIISLWLRLAFLDTNLFFGPEQGRDFLVIKELVLQHRLTLIGPKTDIAGIFHGPVFYYFTAIPFAMSQGDPLFSAKFLIVVNCITVFFIYLLGARLHNRSTGLVAAILFAFSFNAIVYARWLSNPPLSIPLVTMAMFFLIDFLKGNKKSLLGYSICLGLLGQVEFLNILFFVAITLCVIFVFFKRFRKTSAVFLLINFLIVSLLCVGSYILFDIRHQFLITNNILNLLRGQTGFHISLLSALQKSSLEFFNSFTVTVLPFRGPWSFLLLFFAAGLLLIRAKKQKEYVLVILWLFIPVFLLIILRHDVLEQFFVALIPAFILVTALAIESVLKKAPPLGIIIVILVISMQLIAWKNTIPQNKNIFFQTPQPDLRYSDVLKTIDRIYQESGQKSFAVQAYTIPYWNQQAWEYLFWSYGAKKYARLPISQKDTKKLFVIIQDDSDSKYQQDWLKNTVSKWGSVTQTFRYGVLTTRELQL